MEENHNQIFRWVPLSMKIMIIDEDPTSLMFIASALQTGHFQVVSFANPIEALLQLCSKEEDYDLIIVDLDCIILSGCYLVERIVNKLGIPVITTSSEEDLDMRRLSFFHGACFHINKPLTIVGMDFIWKKSWIDNVICNRPKYNKEKGALSRSENAKKIKYARKTLKTSDVDSNLVEHSKVRLLWDFNLNERFFVAVAMLGNDAIPSRIKDIMNVSGLSTKHIASRLQKHRFKMEKEKKVAGNTNEFKTELFLHPNNNGGYNEIMQEHKKESVDNHQESLPTTIQNHINNFRVMESAPLHNQMNLSFDYSSFLVPQPALVMHRNYNTEHVSNFAGSSHNFENIGQFIGNNDEWKFEELLWSNTTNDAEHQDTSMMNSLHDIGLNSSTDFNNFGNMAFANDAFLDEMFTEFDFTRK